LVGAHDRVLRRTKMLPYFQTKSNRGRRYVYGRILLCTLGERMTRDGSARSKQPAQFLELHRFGLLVVCRADQHSLAINQEDGGRVVHCIAARCRHLRVEHVIGARDQCDVLRTAGQCDDPPIECGKILLQVFCGVPFRIYGHKEYREAVAIRPEHRKMVGHLHECRRAYIGAVGEAEEKGVRPTLQHFAAELPACMGRQLERTADRCRAGELNPFRVPKVKEARSYGDAYGGTPCHDANEARQPSVAHGQSCPSSGWPPSPGTRLAQPCTRSRSCRLSRRSRFPSLSGRPWAAF